jgi:stearoyl-CoA desaturase (Delta-9 desaturase)
MTLPAFAVRARSATDSAGAADVQPVAHERRDRAITGAVTLVPLLCLAHAVRRAWDGLLRRGDVVVFALLYVVTVLGVTVGFHRHLTHRSLQTHRAVRAVLAVLGSAAIEGPVISWVADHRKHHAFSDRPGDPHSPHADHGEGWRGALRGLARPHRLAVPARPARLEGAMRPTCSHDRTIRCVDRTFVVWAPAGLALPFRLGVAIGGSVTAGLTGLLWAQQPSRVPDRGAPRTVARADRSLRGVIRALEACGVAWDAVRISPDRQARKAVRSGDDAVTRSGAEWP